MRRTLALLLIAAAAVVAAPSIAHGGGGPTLDIELVSTIEPLTFTATFELETCVEGDFDSELLANSNEVTPISATQSESDPDTFTFVLPSDTEPGLLEIAIECDNGDGSTRAQGVTGWASIPVTKVVSGPAPAAAAFTVHLDCGPGQGDAGSTELPSNFVVDLQYGATGGVKYAYTDHETICSLTEPSNGGATSVTIVPQVIDTSPKAGLYPATVTNTFAAAIQPSFTG